MAIFVINGTLVQVIGGGFLEDPDSVDGHLPASAAASMVGMPTSVMVVRWVVVGGVIECVGQPREVGDLQQSRA